MLEFKGGGFIKINNNKIEFTNAVDSEFINFVKKKIRLNENTEKITKVRFKLTDTGNNKSTNWIPSESGENISRVSDQLGVNFERGVSEYHYVNDSETGTLSKIEMEFYREYSNSYGDWLKAGNATFSDISYDANDYVNEVEYHITVSTPAGSLPESNLVNRLLQGSAVGGSHIVPTKVRFKYSDGTYQADVSLDNPWQYQSGSGGLNLCSLNSGFTQNIENHHPIEYQLRTDDNETFDSGSITLNPLVGTSTGEVPWLPGDTIDFSYTTTVFNE